MNRSFILFFSALLSIFFIDQSIKILFLEGFRWYGDFFSLILTFNKGVAFSMLAFLEGNLKYIQLVIMLSVFLYLLRHKESFKKYSLPAGIIMGAGLSNVYDRFIHGGVVDYFFWHYGFEFAVFNFADVMIDCGVVLILYFSWKKEKVV